MGLFGKDKTPKDQVREWISRLRKETYQLDRQIRTTLRVAGSLQKSTDVMRSMQSLVKVPEVAQTMQELSKEMMKAGIIEEMMQDTLDETLGNDEELEEQAQEEIDKVIFEVTAGALVPAPAVADGDLENPGASTKEQADLESMRERFAALKS
ncbi:charged multivesicular body protein 3-like [Tropilaelaps mercedesae]|uniref:Charged multivesicular body protein 3-like n=1 Tax=Tropilaelaps mercedesae TaxID=418985 RepID=A0A1V9XBH8_9ACAR|nr:charged multivesicular body protein 3-like [Tropilaelaps mercedesae]